MTYDDATKWYMHEPVNETHRILWDFELQKDPLIPARRPDLVIINKKEKEKETKKKKETNRPGGSQKEN